MPVHALIRETGKAVAIKSGLPMMGASGLILRDEGFNRGQALHEGALKNYGSCLRAALLGECKARGLAESGSVTDLKNRLGRSDRIELNGDDWAVITAAGDADILDACGIKVSDMPLGTVKEKLTEIDALPDDLPDPTGAGLLPQNFALRLLRQYLALAHLRHEVGGGAPAPAAPAAQVQATKAPMGKIER